MNATNKKSRTPHVFAKLRSNNPNFTSIKEEVYTNLNNNHLNYTKTNVRKNSHLLNLQSNTKQLQHHQEKKDITDTDHSNSESNSSNSENNNKSKQKVKKVITPMKENFNLQRQGSFNSEDFSYVPFLKGGDDMLEINESYFDKKINDFVNYKNSSTEDLKKEIMTEVKTALDHYKKERSEKELFEKVDSTSYFEKNINNYFSQKLSYSNMTKTNSQKKQSNTLDFAKINETSDSEPENLLQDKSFLFQKSNLKKKKKLVHEKPKKLKDSEIYNCNIGKISSKKSSEKNIINSEIDFVDTSSSMIFIKQQIENFIVDNRKYF